MADPAMRFGDIEVYQLRDGTGSLSRGVLFSGVAHGEFLPIETSGAGFRAAVS